MSDDLEKLFKDTAASRERFMAYYKEKFFPTTKRCDWCYGAGFLEYDDVYGIERHPCERCGGSGKITLELSHDLLRETDLPDTESN